MTIVKWDPFISITSLQGRINRIFNESLSHSAALDTEITTCAWKPPVDIYEIENGIIIKAELPGVKKEDVSIEIKDRLLTLKGERKPDSEIDDQKYYRKERCFGKFYRAFNLESVVDPGKVKARFKDGILQVEIPNPEEEKPKQIKVNVD